MLPNPVTLSNKPEAKNNKTIKNKELQKLAQQVLLLDQEEEQHLLPIIVIKIKPRLLADKYLVSNKNNNETLQADR
ncbi:hypothetical protein Q4488_11010 [Amphritea sp. 1_MG-2023]|uniref:hypothetical protein n=1 Tax=Amphritea sp. 1_MG-2023 TaxID=3062670 RepID=UPI0026E2A392|nr:hypothetical protein [Amphritea sp. 1_MG-2023]MDO6563912.1 hypothetical protein [Amphritea sp. 1_MG-2023]